MADQVTYAAPIGERVYPGTQTLKPRGFHADIDEELFQVFFRGDNGVRQTAEWTGQEAKDHIITMNSSNFSANKMNKWFGQIAIADGKITPGGTAT